MTRLPCEHCDGTGKRDLHEHERSTLNAVGKEWRSTAQINRTVPIQRTALCNRLVRLWHLGLVVVRTSPMNAKVREWRRP